MDDSNFYGGKVLPGGSPFNHKMEKMNQNTFYLYWILLSGKTGQIPYIGLLLYLSRFPVHF